MTLMTSSSENDCFTDERTLFGADGQNHDVTVVYDPSDNTITVFGYTDERNICHFLEELGWENFAHPEIQIRYERHW